MSRVRLPRLRWWGWLGVAGTVVVAYLVALSAIPALFGEDVARADQERARRAIDAAAWSLVVPEDRQELSKAVDEAWRSLRGYRQDYRAGTPAELAAGNPMIVSDSIFNLTADGRVQTQRDTNFTSAAASGSDGREQRFEGFRVLTDRPYVNNRNQRVGDAELIYQRTGGVWGCQRALAAKAPIPAPSLPFTEAGDAGFDEIDGHRVRGFTLPYGAFGLRSPATVWVDVETLLVRRQAIEASLRGQREVWTFSDFNTATEITPPSGITCSDS